MLWSRAAIEILASEGQELLEQKFGASRTLLERKFARMIGESPHRRIKRQQLERARQLLAETELPIARIADLAGFESASYLSASFRRETGENPRAFRAKHR